MADEKEKTEENAGKKSPLMPLIFVAVGAALGGGGVVMMTKPAAHTEHAAPPKQKLMEVHHPDEMKYVFNPVKQRGSTTARIKLKFDYLVDEEFMDDALESIKVRWDMAQDRCIDVLTQFSAKELKSAEGKQMLRRRLVDELTLVFFPETDQEDGTKARVAQVVNVLFTEFFLQS